MDTHNEQTAEYIDIAENATAIPIVADRALYDAALKLAKCYLQYHEKTGSHLRSPSAAKSAQLTPFYESALKNGKPYELPLSKAKTALLQLARAENPDMPLAKYLPCIYKRGNGSHWNRRNEHIEGLKPTLNVYVAQVAAQNGIYFSEGTNFFFAEHRNQSTQR